MSAPEAFGEFVVDAERAVLCHRGDVVPLPPKTVLLLAHFARNRGAVLSKGELLDALWPETAVEEANLAQHVYLLRRTFRRLGAPDCIQTVPRRGYRFTPPLPTAAPRHVSRSPRLSNVGRTLVAAAVALMVVTAPERTAPERSVSLSTLPASVADDDALGRYFWSLRTPASMRRSIPYFEHVVRASPRRAVGYADLANAYTELADFEQPCGACAAWGRRAEALARKAVSLEPDSPEAHTAYGMVARVFRGDDAVAAREFTAALALDPMNPLANQWLGNMEVASGSLGDAERRLRLAASLQPVSTATFAWLARACFYRRAYGDAETYALRALALDPHRLETMVLLGRIQLALGQYAAALRTFEREGHLGQTEDATVWRSTVLAAIERRREPVRLPNVEMSNAEPYATRDLALAYATLGNRPRALSQARNVHFETRLARQLFDREMELYLRRE